MPEASSKDLSHLATVLEDTALCGLIIATSKLVSLPRRGCVLASYSFRVRTGQSLLPPGREGKKKVLIFDVDLDCLARTFGKKQTPSGLYARLDRSNFDRSADLDGRDKASNMVTFHDKCFNDKV